MLSLNKIIGPVNRDLAKVENNLKLVGEVQDNNK